ncbi:phage tail assembly protein [Novacetimonas sp. GS1]|uniref:phage tail assembly protein n=1 Tax=Novacetimonas sp. GS1 TaxID=3119990 RepID=UPI002FCCBA47
MQPIAIPLDPPLRHAGGEIPELVLTEPEAQKMFLAWRAIETGANPEASVIFARDLVAKASGLPESAVNDLPISIMVTGAERLSDAIASEVESFELDESETEFVFPAPVTVGNIEYTSLSLREPTSGEAIKANSHLRNSQGPASQLRYQMALVSLVTGVPSANVHRFPVTIVMKAARAIEVFSMAGRQTGAS